METKFSATQFLNRLITAPRPASRKPQQRYSRSRPQLMESLEPRVLMSATATPNNPQTYSVLPVAALNGVDGAIPTAGLLMDSCGNLFGTTTTGGVDSNGNVYNDGTIFEIPHGTTSVVTLALFNGANGSHPTGDLAIDCNGDLYGTTSDGGCFTKGTVWELVKCGSGYLPFVCNLWSFDGYDGATPLGGITRDSCGNLYGTTTAGGANNLGTVFELNNYGCLSDLSFNGANGSNPVGGVTLDCYGDLFGTTSTGGAKKDGTIFEINHNGSTITTLATFTGTNGSAPKGDLTLTCYGFIFGTTSTGGTKNDGTVFILTPGDTLCSIASFNGTNGATPLGGVSIDACGHLFGTASAGGYRGNGTLWEICGSLGSQVAVFAPFTSNSINVLSSFTAGTGTNSDSNLLMDCCGDIIGTATTSGAGAVGTVFEYSPNNYPSVALPSTTGLSPSGATTFSAPNTAWTLKGASPSATATTGDIIDANWIQDLQKLLG